MTFLNKILLRFQLRNLSSIILYGLTVGILLFSLQVMHFKFLIFDTKLELFAAFSGILFMGLGAWATWQFTGMKNTAAILENEPQPFEPESPDVFIENAAKAGLSKRELEILQLIATGLSNRDVAEKSFISLSTVKTHVSNLFVKLQVQNRTELIVKAKQLKIIE